MKGGDTKGGDIKGGGDMHMRMYMCRHERLQLRHEM